MLLRFREPVSGFSHLFGAILALVAFGLLAFALSDEPMRLLVVLVYGFGVIATLTASSIMHLYNGSQRVIEWLVRLDHASIYLMIAGTYTPVCYLFLEGIWRWGILLGIWAMALAGVVWKLSVWKPNNPWSLAYYLLMGWAGVIMAPQVLPQLDALGVTLFALGGAMYTVGAVVFGIRKPNLHEWFGHHELWHMFVLAGGSLHFWAIVHYIV